MKLNNKGFTLIETIISLAIIAVAGTMFVFGFYNVSTIMGDSAIIKNKTDQLYNRVIANNDLTESDNQWATFKVDGIAKTINGKVQSAQDNLNDVTIKLSRYESSLQAEMVPSITEDVEEIDPETCLKADFKILIELGKLPETYDDLVDLKNYADQYFFSFFDSFITIDKTINPKVTSVVFGNSVGKYVINKPTDNMISDWYNGGRNYLEDHYNMWLEGKEMEFRLFCIEPPQNSNGNYTVYGYLLRKNSRDILFNFQDVGGKSVTEFYDLTDDVISNKFLNLDQSMENKLFKINDDETIYNYNDLRTLKFIKDDSKSIYVAVEYKGN